MPSTPEFKVKGLSDKEVLKSRADHGPNLVDYKKEHKLLDAIKSLVKEPMVILLLVTASIYFISGKVDDGLFLAGAIVIVSTISLVQDAKSRNALEKLKKFTQPKCKVIRNGMALEIASEDLVLGDSLMVEEGISIAADGEIVQSNDFSVDESILTGESMTVYKDKTQEDRFVFYGTTVASGLAIVSVTAIGNDTRLAKIGKSLENIKEEKTPLELQINDFVKKMVIVGAIVFVLVWLINYLRIGILTDSLIKALTLAMSILPEEIPVAFTTFMALGAYRLMKMGIVVKQMKTLETLGSATVICTDKTGTITENKMSLTKVYVMATDTISNTKEETNEEMNGLVRMAMWASEPIPFDPMEVALHGAYAKDHGVDERPKYSMVHEYPLEGKPPMMTHVFEQKDGTRIVAAKGAPEALMAVSDLSAAEKKKVEAAITNLTTDGYRVLGVAQTVFEGDNYPEKQQDFKFEFLGLVAFSDPPKKNITEVLKSFYDAGIVVKIITGDNAATTNAIAKQVGFISQGEGLDGAALLEMSDEEVKEKVATTNIFTRMFPEAKIKIIEALKANKQIVAMTGDGVNDAPALKAANIGIAMGKRGTEIAKGAASLILMEDDLAKIVDAVAMGRRIYTNLKKAIRYIISIHIPIILIVFIPLALGWAFPNIFSPIHVIFFELVMGPTCSIIYENEPMEPNAMLQKPRPFTLAFFNARELGTSIIQGLVITIGALAVYQYGVRTGLNESHTRAMVFVVVIASNISLTLVNRSFSDSILRTIRYKNNLVLLVIGITLAITAAMLYVAPVCRFFQFEPLGFAHLGVSVSVGLVCVLWYELVKWLKRSKSK